jgi:hypothetical protein
MKRIECLLVLVFMMGGVLGIEGVSPGSYEIDFEAGLERDFVFDFVLNEREDLRVLGDFGEYVVLDRMSIFGDESVVVKLKLPEKVDSFGVNSIRILAGDIEGIIKVNVPYPEKYVGLSLAVPNANVGEDVSVNLKVSNLGSEGLSVIPVVEVYFVNKLIWSFEGDDDFVGVSEVKEYDFSLGSANYSYGNYLAVARVDYDGEVIEVEDSFRFGKFDIEILDYTRKVRGGGIEEFEIKVESLYNNKMREVYAEVRAVDGGSVFEGFDSSVVSLPGWEEKTLIGYIDTKGLEGDVSLVVSVHYDGKIESKVVSVYIEKRSYFVFLVVGVLIFIVAGFFALKFFRKSK